MKKIFIIVSILITTILVGCDLITTDTSDTNLSNNQVALDTNSTLALSTYLADGLLKTSNPKLMRNNQFGNYVVTNLSTSTEVTDTTEPNQSTFTFESEIDEVNFYFDKLKVFMNEGLEDALVVSEQASSLPEFENELTYTIEGVTYNIYYNLIQTSEDNEDEDEIEFELTGILVIDGVTYDIIGEKEIEDDEEEFWFKTATKDKDNYVKVEIETESDEVEYKIEKKVDGVVEKVSLKFEEEDNETKVKLKLQQDKLASSYEFKKEVENNETIYKFKYDIAGVKGQS